MEPRKIRHWILAGSEFFPGRTAQTKGGNGVELRIEEDQEAKEQEPHGGPETNPGSGHHAPVYLVKRTL
jgi:hypothetical protein